MRPKRQHQTRRMRYEPRTIPHQQGAGCAARSVHLRSFNAKNEHRNRRGPRCQSCGRSAQNSSQSDPEGNGTGNSGYHAKKQRDQIEGPMFAHHLNLSDSEFDLEVGFSTAAENRTKWSCFRYHVAFRQSSESNSCRFLRQTIRSLENFR